MPSVFIFDSEESANDEAGSSALLRLKDASDDEEPTRALYLDEYLFSSLSLIRTASLD